LKDAPSAHPSFDTCAGQTVLCVSQLRLRHGEQLDKAASRPGGPSYGGTV
jgi:hypothetical protein